MIISTTDCGRSLDGDRMGGGRVKKIARLEMKNRKFSGSFWLGNNIPRLYRIPFLLFSMIYRVRNFTKSKYVYIFKSFFSFSVKSPPPANTIHIYCTYFTARWGVVPSDCRFVVVNVFSLHTRHILYYTVIYTPHTNTHMCNICVSGLKKYSCSLLRVVSPPPR